MKLKRLTLLPFAVFVVVSLLTLVGCDMDEELAVYTIIQETIVNNDTLLYVSVRLENTSNTLTGSESEIVDDAEVTVNNVVLEYKESIDYFQGDFVDLGNAVSINVQVDGQQYMHTVAFDRLTVTGLPEPGGDPMALLSEISWDSPNEDNVAALAVYQQGSDNPIEYAGVSPMMILLYSGYAGDSLSVIFNYAYSLPFSDIFHSVAYYHAQQRDVIAEDF